METIACASTADGVRIDLPATLMLGQAGQLQSALLEAVSQHAPVIIDARNVDRLSTACIQLLVAFTAAAANARIDVSISGQSASFAEAFEATGLSATIRKWEVKP